MLETIIQSLMIVVVILGCILIGAMIYDLITMIKIRKKNDKLLDEAIASAKEMLFKNLETKENSKRKKKK